MAEESRLIADGTKWRKLSAFFYTSFLAMWLVAMVIGLVDLNIRHELFAVTVGQQPHVSDFVNHYAASKIASSGSRAHAYDPALQLAWTNKLIAPMHIDKPFYFQYPPYAFALFLPLSLFSIDSAFWLSGFLSLVFGAGMLAILAREGQLCDRRTICLLVLGCVASLPSCLCLRMGQLSWIMVGLVAAYFWSLFKRRDLLAGACLALTTIKFQYLPVLVAPVLAGLRWKVLIASGIVEALLLWMGGMTVGFHNVFAYPQTLLHAETTSDFTGVVSARMPNLRGAFMLLPGLPGFEMSLVAFLLGVIAAVWILRRGALRGSLGVRWALAISVVIALLSSPHVHLHDLLLLAIAAALTLPGLDLIAIVKHPDRSLAVWSCLLLLYPCVSWLFFLTQGLFGAMQALPFCLINIALLVSGFIYFRQQVDRNTAGEATVR